MNSQLKVIMDGLVYQSQAFGGISRLFTEILPRVCDLDDTLCITLFTQGRLRQSLPRHHRITHLPIPNPEPLMRPGWLFEPLIPFLCRFIRKVYIPTADDSIWHSTYYTIPKKWKGYSIVTVHDMIHERFPDLYSSKNDERFRAIKEHCIRQADAVICVSENTRKDLLHFYGLSADSVYVVPNACNDIFKKGQTEGGDIEASINQPFLLYVGSRACYKNFDLLIHAYSRWTQRKEINLLFVGGKPWSQSEQRALTELGIQSHVKLLGNVDDKTLCYLYNRAVGFVYPSLYEGFGIPLLEAMACGCPIIASRIPSTIEVAKDCPIYFDSAEEDDLLNALDTALSQGCNSKRIQAGLERVKSYSWDKTAAQTLEVYRRI